MPPLKPCVERIKRKDGSWGPCGELSGSARCEIHRRARQKRRLEKDPFMWLYKDPRWTRATREVADRDGHRCTFRVGTKQCNVCEDALLQVHHEEKTRHIWERCGKPQRGGVGWENFIRQATDTRKLRLLCVSHHKHIDDNDPREAKSHPGEQARASVKRQMRSGKRRALTVTKGRNSTRPSRRTLRALGDDDAC